MSKIVLLSKSGFKLDSIKNGWDRCDKSIITKESFLSLKKGDNITILERNSLGFITNFEKEEQAYNTESIIAGVVDNLSRPFSDKNDQLKRDCFSLVFSAMTNSNCNYNVENKDVRAKIISVSHKMYEELVSSNIEDW